MPEPVARILARPLQQQLGRTAVVDHKAGARHRSAPAWLLALDGSTGSPVVAGKLTARAIEIYNGPPDAAQRFNDRQPDTRLKPVREIGIKQELRCR